MLDGAVDDVGDGLEAAVRMIRGTLGLAGGVLDRAEVIEQQERVGDREVDARERSADLEAFALETRRGVDGAENGSRRRCPAALA